MPTLSILGIQKHLKIMFYLEISVWGRVYEFTGLDYWTGLLDWTTGLIKNVINTTLRADTYIYS